MRGLIESNVPAAGQRDGRRVTPRRGLHLSAVNVFFFERRDRSLKIIAHQVEDCSQQLVSGMLLGELALERMKSGLGGRHGEDQPALPNIARAEAENVAKEGAVRFRILAVEQEVRTENHVAKYSRDGERRFDQFRQHS